MDLRNANVWAMVPTFNESENIAALIEALFGLRLPLLDVVVVDDRSPDGTGRIVRGLRAGNPNLHLIERSGVAGRGFAGRDGFVYALEHGADFVIEMDADFSHDPKHIPALLAAMDRADIAVGSRFVAGGTDDDRPWARRVLTVAANLYARTLLGLSVRDTNSGFRCFSRRGLETVDPATLGSRGPSSLHEVLFRAARRGLRVAEVPIEFVDRKKGHSKLDLRRLAAGYFWILKLRLLGK